MDSTDLGNLTHKEKRLVHTLYDEGYLSENAYLQIKAKNAQVSKPETPDESPSEQNYYATNQNPVSNLDDE